MQLFRIVCLFGFGLIAEFEANTIADHRRLHEFLRNNTGTYLRPIFNQSHTLNVTFDVYLTSIQALDEKAQLLHSTIAIQPMWYSDTLRWNATDFGGAFDALLPKSETWTPEIIFLNSVNDAFSDDGASVPVILYESGQAVWMKTATLQTTCPVDITKYPFDTQHCYIKLAKAFSYDSKVQFQITNNKVDTSLYESNGEWELTSTKIKLGKKFKDVLTFVEIEIVLRRRSLFYVLQVLLPVFVLSFMNTLTFKLSPTSGERIGYCISLFLTFVVLLNMISDSIPKVSQNVSYLQLYVMIQFTIGMVITAISIGLVSLAQNSEHIPDSWDKDSPKQNHLPDKERIENTTVAEANNQAKRPIAVSVTECYRNRQKRSFPCWDRFFFIFFLGTYLATTLCVIVLLTV